MATDKARYISGNTKIVATPTPKAAHTCEYHGELFTCCDEDSIDVTFANISDCGLNADVDATVLNGNTYTLAFLQKSGIICYWKYSEGTSDGDIEIYLFLFTTDGSANVNVKIYDASVGFGRAWVFAVDIADLFDANCNGLPSNDNANLNEVGDCYYSVPLPSEINTEGYGGTCDIDWT